MQMSVVPDNTSELANRQDDDGLKAEFSSRLRQLISDKGANQAGIARASGVSTSKLSDYVNAKTLPSVTAAVALADALDTTVDYLILGRPRVVASEYAVPVMDVRLAAGAGAWGAEELIITYMTLDEGLMAQIGRTTTKGLVIMHAQGDSNEPLIRDGAPVLIDEQDTEIREGSIYAFRLGDTLRLKRLRYKLTDIEAVSINPAYPPEIIPYDMRDQFQILGRAIWTSTKL